MDAELYAKMQAELDHWFNRCQRAEDRLHRWQMAVLIFVVLPGAYFAGSVIRDWLVR